MTCLICDMPSDLPDSHDTDDCPHGDGIDPEEDEDPTAGFVYPTDR